MPGSARPRKLRKRIRRQLPPDPADSLRKMLKRALAEERYEGRRTPARSAPHARRTHRPGHRGTPRITKYLESESAIRPVSAGRFLAHAPRSPLRVNRLDNEADVLNGVAALNGHVDQGGDFGALARAPDPSRSRASVAATSKSCATAHRRTACSPPVNGNERIAQRHRLQRRIPALGEDDVRNARDAYMLGALDGRAVADTQPPAAFRLTETPCHRSPISLLA